MQKVFVAPENVIKKISISEGKNGIRIDQNTSLILNTEGCPNSRCGHEFSIYDFHLLHFYMQIRL